VIIAISVIGGLILLALLMLAGVLFASALSRPAYRAVRRPRRYGYQRQMLMQDRDEDDDDLEL